MRLFILTEKVMSDGRSADPAVRPFFVFHLPLFSANGVIHINEKRKIQ